MKYITHFSRLFVGVLFIFSGLIKLNDPMGFGFKLEEYFSEDVLNIPFLEPYGLQFALFVVTYEVILGVALLIGFKPKWVLIQLLLMNVFFAFLTFYSAYFDKVTDCGCFGDAVALTPWGSFTKNVVILVFILILIAGLKYLKPIFKNRGLYIALGSSLVFCIWMGNQVLSHLPFKDFRAYAVGKDIVYGMKPAEEVGKLPPKYQTVYTLKNIEDNSTKVVTDEVYISEKWWENKAWEIESDLTESVLVEKGYEPPIHDFSITNEMGDYTEAVLTAESYLMAISYDLPKADVDGFKKIAKLGWELEKTSIPIVAMTSLSGDEVEQYKHDIQAPFEFTVTDKTTLKTIVRANPGLVYIKDGVIVGKWHYNDLPTVEELQAL